MPKKYQLKEAVYEHETGSLQKMHKATQTFAAAVPPFLRVD